MSTETLRVSVGDQSSTESHAVKEMLEDLGHTVVSEARTGEQLAAQVAAEKPDLVVTDLQMPNRNGKPTMETVADMEATPVVVMTSSHAPQQVKQALQPANVVGYLAKPFGSATLDGALRFAHGLFNRFRGLESRLGTVNRSQADRLLIEQAKQSLMKQLSITEEEAHRKLQKMASASNKKLVELARAVVEASKVERN